MYSTVHIVQYNNNNKRPSCYHQQNGYSFFNTLITVIRLIPSFRAMPFLEQVSDILLIVALVCGSSGCPFGINPPDNNYCQGHFQA